MHPSFAALASLATLAPSLAWANEAGTTLWQCWLQPDQHVACVVAQAAPARALAAAESDALAQAPAITRPGRALPPSVALIRERPGAMAGRLVRIPLHTEPYDTESVAVLTQAVMCGAQPQCRTELQAQPGATRAAAEALADAHDPLLAER